MVGGNVSDDWWGNVYSNQPSTIVAIHCCSSRASNPASKFDFIFLDFGLVLEHITRTILAIHSIAARLPQFYPVYLDFHACDIS